MEQRTHVRQMNIARRRRGLKSLPWNEVYPQIQREALNNRRIEMAKMEALQRAVLPMVAMRSMMQMGQPDRTPHQMH